MKTETMIYDRLRGILPADGEKTILFAAVGRNAHELFFYTFFEGRAKQCHVLEEEGLLDGNLLENTFQEIAEIIRQSKAYDADRYNIATVTVDENGIRMEMEQYAENVRLYGIKKGWKEKNIGKNAF